MASLDDAMTDGLVIALFQVAGQVHTMLQSFRDSAPICTSNVPLMCWPRILLEHSGASQLEQPAIARERDLPAY